MKIKVRNKIGFHFGSQSNATGWGEYIRELDAAGIPAVLMSTGSEGFGDIELVWDSGSSVPHLSVIRCMTHDDVPKYGWDIDTAVNEWLDRYCPTIGGDVIKYHERVITKHGNELDRNQIEWLADFYTALHPALLARMGWASHRIAAFSFAGGNPDPGQWALIKPFLKMCGENPDKFVISLHEYSFNDQDIWARDGGGNYLIGRFRYMYDICDREGFARPHVVSHEWGWRDIEIAQPTDRAMSDIDSVMKMLANYPTYLGAGIWTLQKWQGSGIRDKVQQLIEPVKNLTLTKEYEGGISPPVEPPQEIKVFSINFTGWGEKDSQDPVGWYDSDECPNVQVPYASTKNSRFPMVYQGWEGSNPYNPDGQPWNDYACPEAVVLWDAFLPPDEHYYLNEFGRCQHWFVPGQAGRSRFYTSVYLLPGTYKLTLNFVGDFSKTVDGVKVPQADPQHGQVELFVGVDGQDDMIDINLIGQNEIEREFDIVVAGEYSVGYGILSRYAAGSGGTAGVFLQGFAVTAVDEDIPPIDPPDDGCGQTPTIKRTVHLLPQDITLAEEQAIVAEFHANKNSFVFSHDDAIVIQLAGDPERSVVLVWEPERRNPADLEIMDACGVRWEARYFEDTEPPPSGIDVAPLWQCDTRWGSKKLGV